MGSRRVADTYIYIHNVADPRHPHCTTYILIPPLLSTRSILFSLAAYHLPATSRVSPRIALSLLFLLPRAHVRMYVSSFFYLESGIYVVGTGNAMGE